MQSLWRITTVYSTNTKLKKVLRYASKGVSTLITLTVLFSIFLQVPTVPTVYAQTIPPAVNQIDATIKTFPALYKKLGVSDSCIANSSTCSAADAQILQTQFGYGPNCVTSTSPTAPPRNCTSSAEIAAYDAVYGAVARVRQYTSELGTSAQNVLNSTPQGAQALNAATQATAQVGAGKSNKDGLGCGIDTNFDAGICISNIVYAFTVGLGSGLAYVGGFMFDITISLSLNSAAYALDFLSAGWTTARDLANMAFILILVYIAFTIMFQAETARTMQMLALVIFIALIINFSFFFTRVVIDAGNILAVQFYNSIPAPTMAGTFSTTDSNTGSLAGIASGAASLAPQAVFQNTKDLTASIMQALNIQELFNDNNFKNFAKGEGFMSKFIILSFLYLCIGACYFILAAMFITVGVKFLTRIVILWFLIIASPLAFVAKAIPGRPTISGYYDQWQKLLVLHAFYPAFFLFIFFFISVIMSNLGSGSGILGGLASDLSRVSSTDIGGFLFIASSVANVAIRLGFVVAMLYIGLKASEAIGVQGAEAAQKFTGWATRVGTGAVFGGAGALGRNTIGAGAYAASQSSLIRAGAKYAPGRLLQSGLAGVGRGSFDVRGAPGVRTGLGKLGIDTNEASKGGYEKAVSERISKRSDQAKTLKPSDYELDKAYSRALNNMTPAERDALARAAKDYQDTQENYKNGVGQISRADVKTKKDAYDNLVKNVNKEAKRLAGADYSKEYINNLDKLGFHNLGGLASSGIPGLISRKDKEAAAKLRDSKDDQNRLMNLLKKMGHDGSGGAPTTPPPLPTGGGGGGTRVAANNNATPAAAANTNNPQTPPPPPRGGAPAAPRTPPPPPPAPANSNTTHAGGGAATSALPPLTSSASKAIQDTRHAPTASNDNIQGVILPTKAAPSLWKVEHAANDNEQVEKLTKEIRDLRETMDELPGHMKENTKNMTKSLKDMVKKAANDNTPPPQIQTTPTAANDNHKETGEEKKAA